MKTKRKNLIYLVSICISFIVIKLITFTNNRGYFDEGVYVSIAKYFASLGQVGFFETIRPLGLSVLLTPFQWLPFNSLITGRFVGLIISIICILLIYYVTKVHFQRKAAIWAALLTATSFSFLHYGGFILNDLISYTLVLVAVSFALRQKHFVSGLIAGLSFLFKFPAIVVIVPIGIYILYKKQFKGIFWLGLGTLLTISPYFIFNFIYYGLNDILTPLLEASALIERESWVYQNGNIFKYLLQLFVMEIVSFLAIIVYFKKIVKNHKEKFYLFLGVAVTFLLYFVIRVPRYDPRYVLPVVPFLLVLAGYSFVRLKKRVKTLLIVLMILIVVSTTVISVISNVNHNKFMFEEEITTNSAFPLLYSTEKATLLPGPKLAHTYSIFKDNQGLLIIDPKGYPCPKDDYECKEDLSKRLSRIISSNDILDCGYLHGAKMIIFEEEGIYDVESISKEKCLEQIDYEDLPSVTPKIFLRLNSAVILPDGTLKQLDKIKTLLHLAQYYDLEVYLVLAATDNPIREETLEFLRRLPQNVKLGVIPIEGIDTKKFMERIGGITVISPRFDEWKEGIIPQGINFCINGPWDDSLPCEKIDLYILEDWQEGRFHDQEYLQKEMETLLESDYLIGIDIPAYLLEDENSVEAERLINWIGINQP